MALVDLLPSNATQLEKDIVIAMEEHVDMEGFLDSIPTAKLNTIPDSFIPFLIDEYKLGEVVEFLIDPRVAIAEGIKWHRLKGTVKSLEIAFGWIDFVPTTIDEGLYERYFDFHIDTGLIPNREMIRRIVRLANLSKPARSRLARLYYGYNVAPFKLNETPLNEGILSNFSGIFDEENNVWLSFKYLERSEYDSNIQLLVGSATMEELGQGVEVNPELGVGEGTFELHGFEFFMPPQIWTEAIGPDTIVSEIGIIIGSNN